MIFENSGGAINHLCGKSAAIAVVGAGEGAGNLPLLLVVKKKLRSFRYFKIAVIHYQSLRTGTFYCQTTNL